MARGEVEREALRRQFEKEAVLMAALCRELLTGSARDDIPSDRSLAAYSLLIDFWKKCYGDDAVEEAHYTHTADLIHRPEVLVLGDGPNEGVIGTVSEMGDVAPDLVQEIQLGSAVCNALQMLLGAGWGAEYESDLQSLREILHRYAEVMGTAARREGS